MAANLRLLLPPGRSHLLNILSACSAVGDTAAPSSDTSIYIVVLYTFCNKYSCTVVLGRLKITFQMGPERTLNVSSDKEGEQKEA